MKKPFESFFDNRKEEEEPKPGAAGSAAAEADAADGEMSTEEFFAELDASVGGVGNGGINMMAAFAVYSRLPVPRLTLTKENLRYALCCLPFVGLVIAIAEILWFVIAQHAGFAPLLRAGGLTLIPLVLSGGIHMDGFLDTADAIASRGESNVRQQIMRDPHKGSFAIIGCCAYLIAMLAVYSEAGLRDIGVIACGFFFSRALAGYASLTVEPAEDPGFLQLFLKASEGDAGKNVLLIESVLCAVVMFIVSPKRGVAAIIFALIAYAVCRRKTVGKFGGITGDLQGFMILVIELVTAYAVVLLP